MMNKYQEALEFLRSENVTALGNDNFELLYFHLDNIEELVDKETLLKPQKEYEWIPIEERLPEEKGLYLVAYHPCYWDNVKEDVLVGIDNFMGKTSWSRRKYQRVIAWMPLPDPYKGSER